MVKNIFVLVLTVNLLAGSGCSTTLRNGYMPLRKLFRVYSYDPSLPSKVSVTLRLDNSSTMSESTTNSRMVLGS